MQVHALGTARAAARACADAPPLSPTDPRRPTRAALPQIANDEKVDMVLNGGDLFHENKPTQRSVHKTIEVRARPSPPDSARARAAAPRPSPLPLPLPLPLTPTSSPRPPRPRSCASTA